MEKKVIDKTANFAKSFFEDDFSGHDWWHTHRVWKLSKHLAKKERINADYVQLAALLHDVADQKFNSGNEQLGIMRVRKWLQSLNIREDKIEMVTDIIRSVSFKGAKVDTKPETLESMIVQDADRLDALGAIGIARTFAYGGTAQREIYNPAIKPKIHSDYQDYKKSKGTSINHFYEKILLLESRMNTKSAIAIAKRRHRFVTTFLEEFFNEWEGPK